MKQKFKKLLGILSLVALLITFSCTEDLYKDETHSNYKLSFKKISYVEVSTNKKLVSKLSKLKNEKQTKDANGKIIYSSEYNFYIDTDNGNYIEDENGKHSYVFRVYRDSVQNKLDNIVFASQDDNTYKVLLISYDLTIQEQLNIENGIKIDLSDNSKTIYQIDDENLTNDIFNKVTVIVEGGCITIIEESCSSGEHDDYTGYGGCQPAYHTVNTYTNCDSGGGAGYSGYTGSGGYNNPTGNTGPTTGYNGTNGSTGGHTGSSYNNNSIYTTPTLGDMKSLAQVKREKCFLNDSGLSWEQKAFLNSNTSLKEQVLAYLESLVTDENSTCHTQEAIDIAIDAINSLMNDECAILPTTLNPSEIEADYDPNLFGDYPAPSVQQDHDAIQQQFNNLRNTSGNLAAVNYLISTYNMNTFGSNTINMNYSISFADGLLTGDHANAIIGYNPSGNMVTCELQIDTNLFSFQDFGYITRVIKHELYHVLQAENYGQFNVSNAAREFDAYYSQLFGFRNLKKINDIGIEEGIAKKICEYLDQMTESEKNESEQKINTFNFYFLRICNN